MTDDIRSLTARLADEPGSLAFLELGEALRRRGQLDAAHKVARGGMSRYPGLADAHDLLARILSDQGDLRGAFASWTEALRLDPMHPAAHKGIAFLYFRAGESAAALDHLERALESDPDDETLPAAIHRVQSEIMAAKSLSQGVILSEAKDRPAGEAILRFAQDDDRETAERAAKRPQPEFEPGDGMLLCDGNGLRLAGGLRGSSEPERADAAAAELAGVSKEAARTARLLGLGAWHSIAVESPDGNLVLVPPTADTLLLATREPGLPMARLGLLAERAARDARGWLESQG